MSFTELNRYKIMTVCRAGRHLDNESQNHKGNMTPPKVIQLISHPWETRAPVSQLNLIKYSLHDSNDASQEHWQKTQLKLAPETRKAKKKKKKSGEGGVPIIKHIRVNMCFPEAPHLPSPFLVAPYLLFRHLWFCVLSHAVWVGLASQPAPRVHSHLQALQDRWIYQIVSFQ